MSYIPRLQCPENGNKYYNRKVNGGYSTCIQGNTKMDCYNPYLDTLPNCVGYAMGRFNEIGAYKAFKYAIPGNAEDWYKNAQKLKLKVGQEPKLGAIICWRSGETGKGSDGAGHVAIVEQIIDKNTIVTSESGWSSNTRLFWTQNRKKGSGGNWGQDSKYKFQGFIYNPAVPDEPAPPKEYLARGDKGEEVKEYQKDLNDFGWYDLALDGSFGPLVEKATIDMQTKLNLTPDGIYGPKSKEALKQALVISEGTELTTMIVDKKERQLAAIKIDGNNYIKLKDLYYKLNVAKVTYNENKKLPEIVTE